VTVFLIFHRPLTSVVWNSHMVSMLAVPELTVQGRCTGFKVVKSCSYDGTPYSLVQTLLL